MSLPIIAEKDVIKAASQGMDAFIDLFCDRILAQAGGTLDADSMKQLNGEQITLLGYRMLRDEVMDGGFIQLIHNGLGGFIFLNPFAKAMRLWGESQEDEVLHDFSRLIYKGRKLFEQHAEKLTRPCTDEEFMALYEQYPDFDDLDDAFVEAEEDITSAVAHYLDEHLDQFAKIEK